eukprot:11179-Heterococcus_DN1.PRE.1
MSLAMTAPELDSFATFATSQPATSFAMGAQSVYVAPPLSAAPGSAGVSSSATFSALPPAAYATVGSVLYGDSSMHHSSADEEPHSELLSGRDVAHEHDEAALYLHERASATAAAEATALAAIEHLSSSHLSDDQHHYMADVSSTFSATGGSFHALLKKLGNVYTAFKQCILHAVIGAAASSALMHLVLCACCSQPYSTMCDIAVASSSRAFVAMSCLHKQRTSETTAHHRVSVYLRCCNDELTTRYTSCACKYLYYASCSNQPNEFCQNSAGVHDIKVNFMYLATSTADVTLAVVGNDGAILRNSLAVRTELSSDHVITYYYKLASNDGLRSHGYH